MIIDLHSHLLPGVDDGAQTVEQSLELARLGVKEGVKHLVLTPHHRNGQYLNYKADVLHAADALNRIYQENGIELEVYPSQEIRINEKFMDDLYNDKLLSLDADGKYYLIEFPTASIPDFALPLIDGLCAEGITPVIAHPERNHIFGKDLNRLYEFIELGCLAQLTTSSYAGMFGQKIHDICCQMIERNLVHILASDVHHITGRPFNWQAALQQMQSEYDQEMVDYFMQNARDIFNGDAVKRYKPEKGKKSWFKLF
ncbi:tyrosine-protein phosphatase [Vaginisenegalia massiliensis]|uniref:tyrosine-protein phosphatase n=1 Tax=Vaginisenegalia massiliensis TaxID=2058294 RepID=UPI000F5205C3|nr:CpsB/CapC family capsule biosynthesis tyrosine phosphatase [Vaginisenegalia massiliensis]